MGRRIALKRRRRRRRHQIHGLDGSMASAAKRKDSPCQQDDNSRGANRMRCLAPELPEDIWYQIHSLMPLPVAARLACVSRAFLRFWRSRPNLDFRWGFRKRKKQSDFITKADHILKNHSGIGLKTFRLEFLNSPKMKIDNWLKIVLTAGIEELSLSVCDYYRTGCYNFPCSLLSAGSGNTIQCLLLSHCAFHPTIGFGCLRRLHLDQVCITGEELECLLSNSTAMEQLRLKDCNEIICLKIPCLLQHLSHLFVFECRKLQVIDIKAPNLANFEFGGAVVQPSFRDSLHVKNMIMPCTVHYACTKLPSIAPNLEALRISSFYETVHTPTVHVKFLHLKYLSICLSALEDAFCPTYDYLSLVSFLDACPVLETFIMRVSQTDMNHNSIFGDTLHLRQTPEFHHDNIKNVKIIGFCSAKSMVELACHIVENATSLECLTLDTICYGNTDRCSVHKTGKCYPIDKCMIVEAHNTLLAIEKYIVGKVPSTVKLNVLEPCRWCHALVA